MDFLFLFLPERGRTSFVMASSATDSSGKDREIRRQLIETGHVDVILSVANNFFYTKSLRCSLWFFDRGKKDDLLSDTSLSTFAQQAYDLLSEGRFG